jgi:hypothetical protein
MSLRLRFEERGARKCPSKVPAKKAVLHFARDSRSTVSAVTSATGTMSKSPSLRRIQADVRELVLDPSDRYHAAPLEDDMFEW